MSALVDVDLAYLRETDKAVLFQTSDDRELWIARRLFEWPDGFNELIEIEEGTAITVRVLEWKAMEEGLI